ncbi:SpoIID/LytB domain-containing protein [Candidatus Fermentibacteria bacterium]|nr:SpoIID/LytB domain-containing protein [Candidatus Fermentibacteria bacterium]
MTTMPGKGFSRDSRPEPALPGVEPLLRVGISQPAASLRFFLSGRYQVGDSTIGPGWCTAHAEYPHAAVLWDYTECRTAQPTLLAPLRPACSFTLPCVDVGAGFHWCHREDLVYTGTLELLPTQRNEIIAVNRIGLEEYLESVISSEMNPEAPSAFLEAHAVVARSWALSQLGPPRQVDEPRPAGIDIWEWFDRGNHELFDLCADDHCQRYHGQTRKVSHAVDAVRRTRGTVLRAGDAVVDTRFSKCCGGITELFTTAWGGPSPAGISSVVDAACLASPWSPRGTEETGASEWILGRPPVECAVEDSSILARILLPMDRSTTDFFRWSEEYSQERLASLIEEKTCAGIGHIRGLLPLRRGPSGRIEILEIRGTKGVLRVGKELSIRRLLSPTHLKSSAFVTADEDHSNGVPRKLRLMGAGWGHGVGMCQIGAGVMAARGAECRAILNRYFPEATAGLWY